MYKSRKIYRFLWHNQPLRHLLRRLLHTFSLSLCVHPFLSSSIVLNISPPHSPNTRRIFVLSRGVVGWYGYDGSVCSVSQFSCQQRWGRTNQRCPVCVLHRTQLLLLFAGYFCCRFRIARRSFLPFRPHAVTSKCARLAISLAVAGWWRWRCMLMEAEEKKWGNSICRSAILVFYTHAQGSIRRWLPPRDISSGAAS